MRILGEVFGSSWVVVDAKPQQSAWVKDPAHNDTRYLQLFNGTADLNFRNDKVIEEMTVGTGVLYIHSAYVAINIKEY